MDGSGLILWIVEKVWRISNCCNTSCTEETGHVCNLEGQFVYLYLKSPLVLFWAKNNCRNLNSATHVMMFYHVECRVEWVAERKRNKLS